MPPFPFLRTADAAFASAFDREAHPVRLPAGTFVCMEGDRCSSLALLTAGTARVYKAGDTRELTLYRVGPGESCILTASCILSDRPFPAFALAETDVEALVVAAPVVRRWMDAYPAWQHFIFDLLARRLGDVLALVERVAFERLDARLAAYLNANAVGGVLTTTHEAIAHELGASREGVSRTLKAFEHAGWVHLGRGTIIVYEAAALHSV